MKGFKMTRNKSLQNISFLKSDRNAKSKWAVLTEKQELPSIGKGYMNGILKKKMLSSVFKVNTE